MRRTRAVSASLSARKERGQIDRNMVDSITDSLVHMVRNAVDHGLERPEVRERLGKPPAGSIQLRAYYSSGQVVIELEDDGQGLDDEKIVHKALARGSSALPRACQSPTSGS